MSRDLLDDFNCFFYYYCRAMQEAENSEKKEDNDQRSSASIVSDQTKYSLEYRSYAKLVMINEYDKIIFVRYNSYVMIPWFTISNILNQLDEEKIKQTVKRVFRFQNLNVFDLGE